ncbi:MAG: hypothetical protein ACLQVG_31610 [Terriglobia bacterium]
MLVARSNEDILREIGAWKFIENEGSSGDVDENKEGQVSGVRCQVSGAGSPTGCRTPHIPAGGIPDKLNEAAHRNSSKMKVHPGMLMKTNKDRF